jgi:N-acetylglucosamine-6-phosphate deacetylase
MNREFERQNGEEAAITGTVRIRNARIAAHSGVIENGTLVIRSGKIDFVGPEDRLDETGSDERPDGVCEEVDAAGAWLIPGFVDVHVHGGFGCDFMEASREAFDTITGFHGRNGTTTMLATTVTAPLDSLERVLDATKSYLARPMPYAKLAGVHLEGPFISAKYPGAQNPRYIVPPNREWTERMIKEYPGLIRMVTLAPEIGGALDLIRLLADHGIVPAAGHTAAAYEEIQEAVSCGLRHAVHMFNAMRGLHHREPGTVGAVMSDPRISTELIADGYHVHPACISLMVRLKTDANLMLITDAIAAAGLEPGRYQLGGLDVDVQNGAARLAGTDTLAGSTLTMMDAFRYAVKQIGLDVPEASRLASSNPARLLGLDEQTGSIAPGKQADLLLISPELELQRVWVEGRTVLG